MKTLQNHTLIYDKDCPMCTLYSGAFIKCGMLENDGRENFSEMSAKNELIIDYERAKNEIALINQNSGEVRYGLDSLLVIIGNSFPSLEKIGRLKPLYWFFKKCYSFISYNRKVIVPSSELMTEKSCVPSFNLKYRLLYIFFALSFSTIVFKSFFLKISPLDRNFQIIEYGIALLFIGQIICQLFILKNNFLNHFGNVMTVFLAGSLLLLPFLFLDINQDISLLYFLFLNVIMVIELNRRYLILKK